MELHEEKSQVYPLHRGITLLGFRMFYYYRLPKKSNLRKLERRMFDFKDLYERGELPIETIAESFDGWIAYAEQGNTFKLRKRLVEKFDRMFGVKLAEYSNKVSS